MNVLLIRPKSANIITQVGVIDLEPLDLEYLYTVTKEEGFACAIHDDLLKPRDLTEVLRETKPQVVAIGGYITQEKIMLSLAQQVKLYDKSIFVILGGVHAEVNYERFYSTAVDVIVHTSSLTPYRRLLHLAHTGNVGPELLQQVDGICYARGGEWFATGKVAIDPGELPIPDRSHFNKNKHLYRYLGFSPCAIVKTAFSCPYRCSFCYCRKLNQGKYASRSIDLVVQEIEGIECENIHIIDDSFLLDRARVLRFVELIESRRIDKNFIFYSRSDFVAQNEDVIVQLAKSGTKGIIVGLEALDDGTLGGYGKQVTGDMNEQCVEILARHNIDCLALFIIGIDARKEDFENLYRWIKRVGLKYASVSIFTPIPGTDIYDQYAGKLTSDNVEDWDFLHLVLEPTNMTKQAFYYHYYKLFLQLSVLGSQHGVYDFVDMNFVRSNARSFFQRLAFQDQE